GLPVQIDAGAPSAPSPDMLLGRWTQGDLAYCEDDRYVLEWSDALQLVRLQGRTLDRRRVRYAVDGGTLKVERLTDAGEAAGHWRLVRFGDDSLLWTETAE